MSGLQAMSIPPSGMTQKNGMTVAGDDGCMNQVVLLASILYFIRAVATGTGTGTDTGSTVVGVAFFFVIDKASNTVKKQGPLSISSGIEYYSDTCSLNW